MRRFLWLFLILTTPLFSQDRTGLSSSLAVDFVGEAAANEESQATDRFQARGVEAMFYAPIDHLFDGQLGLAAHNEGGVYNFELHEAFVSSDRLVESLRMRAGQFFIGIGRLSRFHQHDWPFISVPIVQEKFLGGEGIIDSGGEMSYLLPVPFYLDVTVGVTNGYTYGHSHDAGKKPQVPTHYSHVKFFKSVGGIDWQPGFSYLKRVDSDRTAMQLLGFDLTGKYRRQKNLIFLWQSEFWQRQLKPEASERETASGAYFYPQYGLSENMKLGVRYDMFTVNSLRDLSGNQVENSEIAIVPCFSYTSSEFATWRIGYRAEEVKNDHDTQTNRVWEAQVTYIIGAHPAHEF